MKTVIGLTAIQEIGCMKSSQQFHVFTNHHILRLKSTGVYNGEKLSIKI